MCQYRRMGTAHLKVMSCLLSQVHDCRMEVTMGRRLLVIVAVVAGLTSVRGADDVNPLTSVVEHLSQQVTSLQAQLADHESRMREMSSLLQQQASSLSTLQTSVSTLDTEMALQKPFVAFDVHFSRDPQPDVHDHDILKFDAIVSNIGNAYNPQNGMFQAPVSGIYLFHVKVTPRTSGHIYVYLVREGRNIDSANTTDDDHEETGDSIVIVQGERVWVVKNGGVTTVRGWAHTKLAGYLLRAV